MSELYIYFVAFACILSVILYTIPCIYIYIFTLDVFVFVLGGGGGGINRFTILPSAFTNDIFWVSCGLLF